MNFVFRPQNARAAELRSMCLNMGKSLKRDGTRRRVYGGFLIQVTRTGQTVIASVVEPQARLFCVVGEGNYAMRFSERWDTGFGIGLSGDPTTLFETDNNPVFEEPARQLTPTPTNYLGTVPCPDLAVDTPGDQFTQAGGWSVGKGEITMAYNLRGVILLYRVSAGSAMAEGSRSILGQQTPVSDSLGNTKFLGIGLQDFGFPPGYLEGDGFIHSTQSIMFATFEGRVGYVGVSVRVDHPDYYRPERLHILRIDIVEDEESGELSLQTALVRVVSEATVPAEDRNTDYSEAELNPVLPPNVNWINETRIAGDVHPDLPEDAGTLSLTYSTWQLTGSVNPESAVYDSKGVCRATQIGSNLYVFYTTRAARATGLHTLQYTDADNPAVTTTVQRGAGYIRRETTRLLTIIEEEVSDRRIHTSEISLTDPATWDNELEQFYVEAVSFADGKPVFACTRTLNKWELLVVEQPGYTVTNVAFPSVRMPVGNIGVAFIHVDGTIVRATGGGTFPACFATHDGRTGGLGTYYVGDGTTRRNLGRRLGRTVDISYSFEQSSPVIAAHYADGMAVFIKADNASFTSNNPVCRLVVYNVLTGEVVKQMQTTFLALTPSTGDGFNRELNYVRWNVTCAEQALLDEEGEVVVDAILLLSVHNRFGAGFVFAVKDFFTMQQVCNVAGAATEGPVYYLGTPLQPAHIGVSALRGFIKGKPVNG